MGCFKVDIQFGSYVGVWDGHFPLRITIVYAVVSAVFDVSVWRFTSGTVVCVFAAGFAVPIVFTATLGTLGMKTMVELHTGTPVIHHDSAEWEDYAWFWCQFRSLWYFRSTVLSLFPLFRRF